MNKREVLQLLKITVGASIIIFFVLITFFNQGTFKDKNIVRYISLTITLITSFWVLYFSFLWRFPLLKRIIYKPYIGGVWIGYANSDYEINGKKVPPFKIVLIIKQTFLTTKIIGCSKTYHSISYVESFIVSEDKSGRVLAYLYHPKRSTSKQIDGRSGASELHVFLGVDKSLKGDFWTQGGSTGFIGVYRKPIGWFEKIESFVDAENKWKSSYDWK